MNSRYEQIMDRVRVTDEMRTRVLDGVRSGTSHNEAPSERKHPGKLWLSMAACLALVFFCGLQLGRLPAEQPSQRPQIPTGSGHTMAVPPFTELESQELLEAAVGFPMEQPAQLPFPLTETRYTAYGSDLGEVTWLGGGESLTLRKSAGQYDNSGVYLDYPRTVELTAGAWSAELRGEAESFELALWRDEEFSYSLRSSVPLAESVWRELLEGMAPA